MTIVFDIIFTFSQGIPKFDRLVARTRNNLPVVSTETDRQDIGGVADKSACGRASVEVPQS